MTLRVAMIGHGFMGAAHSVGWRHAPRTFPLPDVEMSVIVGRNAGAVADAASRWAGAKRVQGADASLGRRASSCPSGVRPSLSPTATR